MLRLLSVAVAAALVAGPLWAAGANAVEVLRKAVLARGEVTYSSVGTTTWLEKGQPKASTQIVFRKKGGRERIKMQDAGGQTVWLRVCDGKTVWEHHVAWKRVFQRQLPDPRRLRNRERYGYDFSLDFEVESYLRHQGQSFVERFDANSMLYITKALDYFDLAAGHESLTEAFRGNHNLFLLIAFSSDWLYPPHQLKDVAKAIRRSGGEATYYEISSDYGHDAFLLEYQKQEPLVASFLRRVQETAP